MSDQCKGCTLRGDFDACQTTECHKHEDWHAIQLKSRIESLTSQLSELKAENEALKQGWISAEDRLPEVGEWVSVFEDKSAYSSVDEHGEPEYLFSSSYYHAEFMGHEMKRVTSGQLRYISDDGWGHWQQGSISSGHALVTLRHVTHWMPLPTPPSEQK